MKNTVNLQDVKEMLEQLNYSDFKEEDGVFIAKNCKGEERRFSQAYSTKENAILLISNVHTNNEYHKNREDHQFIELEFEETEHNEDNYKCIVYDIISKFDMSEIMKNVDGYQAAEKEVININFS